MTPRSVIRKLFTIALITYGLMAPQIALSQNVAVSGTVVNGDTPLCSLVLVNGENQFTCDGTGAFEMQAPLDSNGTLTVQVFVDGFAPYSRTLAPSVAENQLVQMVRPNGARTMVVTPEFSAAGAGRAFVTGQVATAGGTPICAFVLANGEQMFSCDDNLGQFELDVPLDQDDKVKLQIFAAGFQPYSLEWDANAPPPPAVCDKSFSAADVYIVDLSQDSTTGASCYRESDRQGTADCVENRIRAAFSDASSCLGAFDVFVPGTNQEDGDFRQFTSIISALPGRTYLSVQYTEKATLLDDAIQYDKSVGEASTALDELLYTLREKFETTDVRVFGHSKGSDAVARVSAYPEHDDLEFYAFAQAGRTPSNLRGTPGYIEKLDDNLVGITWQNDEVKFYTGGSNGLQAPEIWGFPGYINQTSTGLTVAPSRIDHHNNYGGDFEKEDYPYCATGNKVALLTDSECKKQFGVRYLPYFWGNEECAIEAYEMMQNGYIGERYYIGYSGPRASGCKDTVPTVLASYELTYLLNLADQGDCRYNMKLSFDGLDSGTNRSDGSSISLSSTKDTKYVRKTGSIRVPLHMRIDLKTSMDDVSGPFSKCQNLLGAKSEGFIYNLSVSFNHPQTGRRINRTLIGNAEGVEYLFPLKLADKNNVGWRKSSGSWDLHYGISSQALSRGGGLMVKGTTGGGYTGNFYKWVHLID